MCIIYNATYKKEYINWDLYMKSYQYKYLDMLVVYVLNHHNYSLFFGSVILIFEAHWFQYWFLKEYW